MKFKNIFSCVRNSCNNQYNFSLKIKQLRKLYPGMTPEELMELTMPKPRTKFYYQPKSQNNKK